MFITKDEVLQQNTQRHKASVWKNTVLMSFTLDASHKYLFLFTCIKSWSDQLTIYHKQQKSFRMSALLCRWLYNCSYGTSRSDASLSSSPIWEELCVTHKRHSSSTKFIDYLNLWTRDMQGRVVMCHKSRKEWVLFIVSL